MTHEKSLKTLKIVGFSLVVAIGLTACIVSYLMINSFYLRHESAARRWQQREPYHYVYDIHLSSMYFGSNFQIEILNNKVVRTFDLDTGEPAKMINIAPGSYLHQTSMLRDYIIIDQILKLIKHSRTPPKTIPSFLNRLDPTMYAKLVNRGILPGGREGCDPAFPKVIYNRQYGYPERLDLYGSPCALIFEQKFPIYIHIDSFQVLP